MHNTYDAIVLSPHLDDAALSCGGQIAMRTGAGERVLVVTIMAGSPPSSAQSEYIAGLHTRWELEGDAAAQRRAEDIAACRILGADFLHLDVPDCIYRFHPQTGLPLYISDDDIFGDVHPAELRLLDDLVDRFRRFPPAAQVYAPLTVGHHVDHHLVRHVAARVWPETLLYYEDYPYAQQAGKLAAVIGDGTGWHNWVVALDAAALRAKFEAIWAFRSQMSTFFTSRADMEKQVGSFVQAVGGERLWQRPAKPR
jgi:LmbE family N-acetylglucosaminyl deacetylase